MDRRKDWREEEQRLVEKCNAASERFRTLQQEMSQQPPAEPNDELKSKMQQASAEMETLRRHVARLKVEFTTGKRY